MAGFTNEEGESGLQIAPMLDVMFVLLLFFMVSAGSVLKETELGVNVPGHKALSIEFPPIRIDIFTNGGVRFNGVAVDSSESKELPSLRAKLKHTLDLDPAQKVSIHPEGQVEHERLVDVLNACSWAGVAKISFAGK